MHLHSSFSHPGGETDAFCEYNGLHPNGKSEVRGETVKIALDESVRAMLIFPSNEMKSVELFL
jgi:hypothetical protein